MRSISTLCSLLALAYQVVAQAVPAHPLVEDGFLEAVTTKNTAAFNSGGSITINGRTITVPDNLLVEFPAAFIPFKDFAASAASIGLELAVTGNVVNGVPIAAQIDAAQLLARGGSGIITAMDGANGLLTVSGGPQIRINDPNGVFGVPYTLNPFFTADDENPSIQAFSGFPMCIPRSATDALCPASNRPANTNTFQAVDPLVMAPLKVGDQIDYHGIKVGNQIIAYSIVATSVQITTTGTPTYIRMEDAIIGTFDSNPNAEFAEMRFIGYVSDPTVSVTINAIDVDPCTNTTTDRLLGAATPKAGEPRNKFIFRADTTTFGKYTREYRIKASTGTKLTKNGILAGQYVQPVTEWIFPENTIGGILTPEIDFSGLQHLANGFFEDDQHFGQLTPWPGSVAPTATPATCPTAPPAGPTNIPPTANAGADITTLPGSVVVLKASNTNAQIPAAQLKFTWTQTSGPTVTISGTGATVSFTAPAQSAASPVVSRTFRVTVSQLSNAALSSTDDVIVKTDRSVKDTVTITSYTYTNQQGGTISVTAQTNYVVDGAAAMKLTLLPGGLPLTMNNAGGGIWTYSSRSTKQPAGGIRVSSSLGGTTTRTTVTAKKRSVEFEA